MAKEEKTNAFWGPYISNRQWGTVREDTSTDGNSWDSFKFQEAGKRRYRSGGDGLFGFCDVSGTFITKLSLWNHKDEIIKERLFGLSGTEGNHGEDMKELFYYVDGLPDHSYMKAIYRYPQNEFPYEELLQRNLERNQKDPEFELTDTGIFDEDEYFDVVVEYGKDPANEKNLVCCYTITNHSSQSADITVLPQFWLPNDVSQKIPVAVRHEGGEFCISVDCGKDVTRKDVFLNKNDSYDQCEISFEDCILKDKDEKPYDTRKYGCMIRAKLNPHETKQIHWSIFETLKKPGCSTKEIMKICRKKAEEFYSKILPGSFSPDDKLVARQAFAGLLWNKQIYKYNGDYWRKCFEFQLKRKYLSDTDDCSMEDVKRVMESNMMKDDVKFIKKHCRIQHLRQEWRNETKENKSFWDVLCRNREWKHVKCDHILSVPDKWEFPWFATWDTAFQMLPFARLAPSFTKNQLLLFLGENYMKADGQMPGCEWDMDLPFPPVYAWSCYHVFSRTGHTDIEFLQHCFQKLQLNFKWWLNSMQVGKGSYLFTGGFLGMDNISAVDRSFHLKQKHPLIQADATGWMAFFALSMLEIALVLSSEQGADHKYYRACDEYLKKFILISEAMNRSIDNGGVWHPHDKFFYDVVKRESGVRTPIALRSLVGIVPLLACLNIKVSQLQSKSGKNLRSHLDDLLQKNSSFVSTNVDGDYVLCAVPKSRFLHIMKHLTDDEEFLSPFGIRSLSKVYEVDPYILTVCKEMQEYLDLYESKLQVKFTPAESDTAMMGGNSNWRGPIWLCMNFLIVEMLLKLDKLYGDGIKMNHPSSSNAALTLGEIAEDISKRVVSLFAVNKKTNARPCHGNYEKYRLENSWRDLVLFYEYFDSETGRGCGASHQTGWTSLVLEFLHLIRHSESTNMTEKYDSYCSAFDNASDFSAD